MGERVACAPAKAGRWRAVLTGLALVLGSAPAAADEPGFYADFSLGAVLVGERDITGAASPRLPGGAASVDYATGYAGGVALGYDFGALRLEGELRYAQSDVDGVTSAGAALTGGGALKVLGYMANAHLDVPLGGLVASLGGGAGVAIVTFEDTRIGATPLTDDGGGVAAYQLLAGLAYPLSPKFSLLLGYRYFLTDDVDLKDLDGRALSADYAAHSARIGLRVRF